MRQLREWSLMIGAAAFLMLPMLAAGCAENQATSSTPTTEGSTPANDDLGDLNELDDLGDVSEGLGAPMESGSGLGGLPESGSGLGEIPESGSTLE